MKFSLRTLLILVAIISVAMALGMSVYRTHQWYNHEIATMDLGGGYELRLWSYGDMHRDRWVRHVDWNVSGNGKTLPIDRHPFWFCHVENVSLIKSDDANYVCVSSPDHPKLLLLGDVENGRFFRHHEFLGMPDGPYRRKWKELIEEFHDQCDYLDVEHILAGYSLRYR